MWSFPVADGSEVTDDNGLPVLGADDLVDVERVGLRGDVFLQIQLAANQSPLLRLRLTHRRTQSERPEIKRCHVTLSGLISHVSIIVVVKLSPFVPMICSHAATQASKNGSAD